MATSSKQQKEKLKWYETESPALIVVLLIIFFPLGLWSMWKYAKWSSKTKGIIIGIIALLVLANGFNKSPSSQSKVPQVESSSEPANLSEINVHTTCRQAFPKYLELPSNAPIHNLTNDLRSLVIDRSNPNNGRLTQLPDGRTILAGHALIQESEGELKTRHFICILKTSDGSLQDFIRGKDKTWKTQ